MLLQGLFYTLRTYKNFGMSISIYFNIREKNIDKWRTYFVNVYEYYLVFINFSSFESQIPFLVFFLYVLPCTPKYFFFLKQVRCRAAHCLTRVANAMVANWNGPPAMMQIFRKMFGSFSCPNIIRQHDFTSLQNYFILKVRMLKCLSYLFSCCC